MNNECNEFLSMTHGTALLSDLSMKGVTMLDTVTLSHCEN